MKEKYKKPEIEIVEFETEDVITTSRGGDGGSQDTWIGGGVGEGGSQS